MLNTFYYQRYQTLSVFQQREGPVSTYDVQYRGRTFLVCRGERGEGGKGTSVPFIYGSFMQCGSSSSSCDCAQ